jgi:hypothetical protein
VTVWLRNGRRGSSVRRIRRLRGTMSIGKEKKENGR